MLYGPVYYVQANKNMLTFGSYLKTVSNHPSPYFKVSALRAVIHLLRPSQSIGPLGCFWFAQNDYDEYTVLWLEGPITALTTFTQ